MEQAATHALDQITNQGVLGAILVLSIMSLAIVAFTFHRFLAKALDDAQAERLANQKECREERDAIITSFKAEREELTTNAKGEREALERARAEERHDFANLLTGFQMRLDVLAELVRRDRGNA